MIRPAIHADVPRLLALLEQVHAGSRLASVPIAVEFTKKMLGGMIQRNGFTTVGGGIVSVWDDGDIRGFIVGGLDRVYSIGRQLWSSDHFLVVEPGQHARVMMALLASYIDWSDRNPLVIETRLSWSDVTPDGARLGPVFEGMGFVECGRAYRRDGGGISAKVLTSAEVARRFEREVAR